MAYLRGFSERGIDYDAATRTLFLPHPNPDSEAWLERNFPKVGDGRWTIRKGRVAKVASFARAMNPFSPPAPPEVFARRRLSCLGDDQTPPCEMLVKTASGSWCSKCDCGRWRIARLDGTTNPKLSRGVLDCPLRKPGFSNEAAP